MKFTFQEIAAAGTGYNIPVSENDNGFGGVFKVLNFMTGDNLHTLQLLRAYNFCKDFIISQHPWVGELQNDFDLYCQKLYEEDKDRFKELFTETVNKYRDAYGDEFELTPISDWEKKDPVQELVEMVGPDKTIVVITDSETAVIQTPSSFNCNN